MILVTGATGFVGKAVVKKLSQIQQPFFSTSKSLGVDLCDRALAEELLRKLKPHAVIHCAAHVGGIQFGIKNPVDVFEQNMMMTLHLFSAAQKAGVKRLIHPISNCIYPAQAHFFKEDEVWDGPLHDSVKAYGTARKALYVAAQSYYKQYGFEIVNLVLSNMYGPGDHFEEERSHALGALIQKFSHAQKKSLEEVVVWGSGDPVREWLYIEDAAEALVRALDIPYTSDLINIGHGQGITVRDLAQRISEAVAFKGKIRFDTSKPDGAVFKTVDGARGAKCFSWRPETTLEQGLPKTLQWYEDTYR